MFAIEKTKNLMSDEIQVAESQADTGGAQVDELKAKAREYEAKLAEYEARDREREDEELRKRGEFEKLLESERKEKAEILAKMAARDRKDRFARTAQAVSAKAGISLAIAEALLLREEAIGGADVAPEEISDDYVVDLAKRLRAAAPDLFQTESKGGSPGIPGLNMGNKKPGESNLDSGKARAQRIAKALSSV